MNRINIYYKSIFLAIASISLNSCDYTYLSFIDRDLYDFANFKKGSYWIYHNDSLNINDTVSVCNNYQDYEAEESDGDRYYDEIITITYKSSFESLIIKDIIKISGVSRYSVKYYPSDTAKWTEFDVVNKNVNLRTAKAEYIYNYKINGVNYKRLIRYKSDIYKNYHHKSSEVCKVELYFSLDKGIVQKIYTDSIHQMNWYLVKCKIVK